MYFWLRISSFSLFSPESTENTGNRIKWIDLWICLAVFHIIFVLYHTFMKTGGKVLSLKIFEYLSNRREGWEIRSHEIYLLSSLSKYFFFKLLSWRNLTFFYVTWETQTTSNAKLCIKLQTHLTTKFPKNSFTFLWFLCVSLLAPNDDSKQVKHSEIFHVMMITRT